jgi:hypothetical protein
MILSKQEEQRERYETLINDKRVREQTGTFLSHTHDDLGGGRFAAISNPHVVGSTAVPIYPAAALQHDPVGLEPPLSYRIDEMPEPEPAPTVVASPSSELAPATDSLPAPSTPPASMSDAGRLSFSPLSDPAVVSSQPSRHVTRREAGSLPRRRL